MPLNKEEQVKLIKEILYKRVDEEFNNEDDRQTAKDYLAKTILILFLQGMPIGNTKYSQVLRLIADACDLLPENQK